MIRNIKWSAARTMDRLAFATGWMLVMWMAVYPGPLALQIVTAVLFGLFIVSTVLCLKASGWSLRNLYKDGEERNGALSSVGWMIAFAVASQGSPEVRSVVGGIALAVLVMGLLYLGLKDRK